MVSQTIGEAHKEPLLTISSPLLSICIPYPWDNHPGPETDVVYLPKWMMSNLLVDDGARVQMRLMQLPPIKFVKLQPKTSRFSELVTTPKDTLEYALRSYTTLTLNDSILIKCMGEDFYLDVVELKPAGAVNVVGAEVCFFVCWRSLLPL